MAATVRSYDGKRPDLGRGVFLAETCAVIGDVVIGEESSIWYGTVVRGDVMPIRIGARTSIQDNTVIHVTSDFSGTIIGSDCTVGHNAIIHACTVEDFCLIGMGSILLDGAILRALPSTIDQISFVSRSTMAMRSLRSMAMEVAGLPGTFRHTP